MRAAARRAPTSGRAGGRAGAHDVAGLCAAPAEQRAKLAERRQQFEQRRPGLPAGLRAYRREVAGATRGSSLWKTPPRATSCATSWRSRSVFGRPESSGLPATLSATRGANKETAGDTSRRHKYVQGRSISGWSIPRLRRRLKKTRRPHRITRWRKGRARRHPSFEEIFRRHHVGLFPCLRMTHNVSEPKI